MVGLSNGNSRVNGHPAAVDQPYKVLEQPYEHVSWSALSLGDVHGF
jgi:hypothetical protein